MSVLAIICIWYGVVVGVLDIISDFVYLGSAEFESPSFKNAVLAFCLLQPLWYLFLCLFYGLAHPDSSAEERSRARFFYISPLYTLLIWFKVLPGSKRVYNWFTGAFNLADESNLRMFTLENSFRVQVFSEVFLQALPQMIVQATNNSEVGWSGAAYFAFIFSFLLFLKDLVLMIVFFTQRIFDGLEVNMRPGLVSEATPDGRRAEREVYFNLRGYLQEPDAQQMDEEGNTTLHQATKLDDASYLETQVTKNPHLLFMLNKEGYTPLDVAIMEGNNQRAELLITRTKKFHPLSSIRFVDRPNRLEMKYEKPFTLAVYTNNVPIMTKFPKKSIRTSFVSMS